MLLKNNFVIKGFYVFNKIIFLKNEINIFLFMIYFFIFFIYVIKDNFDYIMVIFVSDVVF